MNSFDKIREIYNGECYTIEKSRFGLPEEIGWTISNSDYAAEIHLDNSTFTYPNSMQDKILAEFINEINRYPESSFKEREEEDIKYLGFDFCVLDFASTNQLIANRYKAHTNDLGHIIITYTGAQLKYI